MPVGGHTGVLGNSLPGLGTTRQPLNISHPDSPNTGPEVVDESWGSYNVNGICVAVCRLWGTKLSAIRSDYIFTQSTGTETILLTRRHMVDAARERPYTETTDEDRCDSAARLNRRRRIGDSAEF